MKRAFIIALAILSLTTAPSFAEAEINHFPTLPKEDLDKALEQAKVKSCKEYKQAYFDTGEQHLHLMQALAYYTGLCVEQDLKAAHDHYLIVSEGLTFVPMAAVPLALIYKFGPDDFRDEEKAFFYARQAAIMPGRRPL